MSGELNSLKTHENRINDNPVLRQQSWGVVHFTKPLAEIFTRFTPSGLRTFSDEFKPNIGITLDQFFSTQKNILDPFIAGEQQEQFDSAWQQWEMHAIKKYRSNVNKDIDIKSKQESPDLKAKEKFRTILQLGQAIKLTENEKAAFKAAALHYREDDKENYYSVTTKSDDNNAVDEIEKNQAMLIQNKYALIEAQEKYQKLYEDNLKKISEKETELEKLKQWRKQGVESDDNQIEKQ